MIRLEGEQMKRIGKCDQPLVSLVRFLEHDFVTNWTDRNAANDAACAHAVLKKMNHLGLIQHRRRNGRDVWIVDGVRVVSEFI